MLASRLGLAVLLAAFLLLAGCNYSQPLQGGDPLFEPPESKSMPEDTLREYLSLLGCADVNTLDACKYKQALAARKPQSCKDISVAELRDTCLDDVWRLARDKVACTQINDATKPNA